MTRSAVLLVWGFISLSLTTCGVYAGGADESRGLRSASGGNDETRPPQSARIEFTPRFVLKGRGSKSRDLDLNHDYVAKGDSIEVFITPQEDAFVYLGYCIGNEFKLYPEADRALRAEARRRFKIPESFDIDDDSVLYVIVSSLQVSLASPELAIAIAEVRKAAGLGAMDSDCTGRPGGAAGGRAPGSRTPPATPIDGRAPGSQTPSVIPIDVRAPKPLSINVVRYDLLRQAQPATR